MSPSMGETHRTKHNTMTDDTIDCTPRGCQTPEGVARVNAAMEALEAATARCANVLQDALRDERLASGRKIAREAVDAREAAFQALVRALGGRQ